MKKKHQELELQVETVEDDAAITWQAVDGLRKSFYTHAEHVAGALVLEGEPDESGRIAGFLVIGELALEVLVDLSQVPLVPIVPVEARA